MKVFIPLNEAAAEVAAKGAAAVSLQVAECLNFHKVKQ